ncbi:MAG: GNAT family N-acetyltransferase [Anaerolineales bacterium]|nr:GNAT family N-acetyltransferase [Anaerolineales bacterium]MCX7608048.1 GNAT family N-acetyltransferase [Anaerolineales bacterium]MDW8227676.1 N-acetyltransferase [Anaerolineales bacterium]
MDILPARLLDLPDLYRIERICFAQDAWPLLDLVAVLVHPNVVRLKAVMDGRMVGFIAGDLRHGEEIGWIATLGVLPAYRRRGIGRTLLRACEAQMKTAHFRLCVRTDNLEAINLYQQEGYQRIDLWRGYYRDGGDALVMEKPNPSRRRASLAE